MVSGVIFSEFDRKVSKTAKDSGVLKTLRSELSGLFCKGERIAIKLHMGEPGNKTYIEPGFVRDVVVVLKDMGCEPFLFDSPVIYGSPRNSENGYLKAAGDNGFSAGTMGCPVIVSDEFVGVQGRAMTYNVCRELVKSDGVLVLTHLKGHTCCGFGGAIKNLGMGAQAKETKGAIHSGGKPVYAGGCTLCGACEKSCPLDNIRYDSKRPHFDKNWCCGCSDCVLACKVGALKTRSGFGFDFLLADAAGAALNNFRKIYFVNVIKNITRLCDCVSNPGKIIMPDVGVVMGRDIVAVDLASLDLCIMRAGDDVFLKAHKKSPLVHIKEAERLGMGSTEYKLERV